MSCGRVCHSRTGFRFPSKAWGIHRKMMHACNLMQFNVIDISLTVGSLCVRAELSFCCEAAIRNTIFKIGLDLSLYQSHRDETDIHLLIIVWGRRTARDPPKCWKASLMRELASLTLLYWIWLNTKMSRFQVKILLWQTQLVKQYLQVSWSLVHPA